MKMDKTESKSRPYRSAKVYERLFRKHFGDDGCGRGEFENRGRKSFVRREDGDRYLAKHHTIATDPDAVTEREVRELRDEIDTALPGADAALYELSVLHDVYYRCDDDVSPELQEIRWLMGETEHARKIMIDLKTSIEKFLGH